MSIGVRIPQLLHGRLGDITRESGKLRSEASSRRDNLGTVGYLKEDEKWFLRRI
jgi:hypothetical protein